MDKIPTYNFHDLGRAEKLVDLFIWSEPDLYQIDKPHGHEYHEIMIFYKGAGSHEIDFKTFETQDNSFHIIPQNFIHRLNRNADSSGFTIALSQVFVEQLCQFDPNTNYYSLFEKESIIQLTQSEFADFRFYLEEIRKPATTSSYIQNICSAILLKLFPYIQNKSSHSNFTIKVRKSLEENFKKRLSTIQYAEMLHMSPIHLNVKLKNTLGKTMMQLQDDMLITKIKRQLYSTESNINEIAEEYGYKDYAHFSKFFKNKTGYSPSQYRLFLKNIQETDNN